MRGQELAVKNNAFYAKKRGKCKRLILNIVITE